MQCNCNALDSCPEPCALSVPLAGLATPALLGLALLRLPPRQPGASPGAPRLPGSYTAGPSPYPSAPPAPSGMCCSWRAGTWQLSAARCRGYQTQTFHGRRAAAASPRTKQRRATVGPSRASAPAARRRRRRRTPATCTARSRRGGSSSGGGRGCPRRITEMARASERLHSVLFGSCRCIQQCTLPLHFIHPLSHCSAVTICLPTGSSVARPMGMSAAAVWSRHEVAACTRQEHCSRAAASHDLFSGARHRRVTRWLPPAAARPRPLAAAARRGAAAAAAQDPRGCSPHNCLACGPIFHLSCAVRRSAVAARERGDM